MATVDLRILVRDHATPVLRRLRDHLRWWSFFRPSPAEAAKRRRELGL